MTTNKQWAAMSKLVTSIANRPDAEPFREPVDWKNLGLHDYPQLIKKPMDLGTVQTNMKKEKYKSIPEAADDVRLVWQNCMTYNADGSDFFLLAKSLSKRFEEKYGKLVAEQGIDVKASKVGGGGATGAGAGSSFVTLDEKKMFARSLYKISKEDLGKILVEVDNKCPVALTKNAGEDEAELNIDKIPADLFAQLKAFVADCNKTPAVKNGGKKK